MKSYLGYIRVSTQRQGIHGVSLQEQRLAIDAYAKRNGLEITAWYEEQETAAKRGRRQFTGMLRELTRGKADGVIFHKIDRSARNIRDWADLGELIDRGIDVHFAHDALDLRSRGGRLSADIQAVVAADFIRNLREETRKGMYGRLKQGLYPLRAPIGYLDMGGGNVKEIDPVQGPLVRQAFELYSTGGWTFHTIQPELSRRGLRGKRGTPVSLNGLTTLLNNPFYTGLIRIRKTGEIFDGSHRPLISQALFERVQSVLHGRRDALKTRHDFLFRRLLTCASCGRSLIGESQKGRFIYYRCHSANCKGVSIPESAISDQLSATLFLLQLSKEDLKDLRDLIGSLRGNQRNERAEHERSIRLQLSQVDERMTRLTDLLIDMTIDKDIYEERKAKLLKQKRGLSDQLENLASSPFLADIIEEKLERANTAYSLYKIGNHSEKRDLVISISSNCIVDGKNLAFTLYSPYQDVLKCQNSSYGDPYRDEPRTRVEQLYCIFKDAAEREAGYRLK